MQVLPNQAPVWPQSNLEVHERIEYAKNLRKQAIRLIALGDGQDKVDEVFQKLAAAQAGLYYFTDKKSLESWVCTEGIKYDFSAPRVFLRKHIAFFDRTTGTLTISDDEAKKNRYKIGQELTTNLGNKAQMGFYYWDKKSKTIKEFPVSIVFHDSECVNQSPISCGFYNYKEDVPEKINRIEILAKEGMKQLVNTFSTPVLVPLFDISDEKDKAQIQGKTIRPQMQIGEESGINSILENWLEEPLDLTDEIVNHDIKNPNGNIYMIDKNNFLSNDYLNGLIIPGDSRSPYKSVTHYLIYKKIDKCSLMGLNVKGLEKEINRCKTAHDAYYFYKAQAVNLKDLSHEVNMFHGLDNELKKALFYKFVGPDGIPNEAGKKLLDTGDGKIYAGHETVTAMVRIPLCGEQVYHVLGDPSYHMEFVGESLRGANKLGKCLMELRAMLRKQEQKNGNLNLPYTSQNPSPKPLPQPKPRVNNSPYQISNVNNAALTNL